MKFKRLVLVFGGLILGLIVVLSWGCQQNQPTAPETGENLNTVSSKTRATPYRLRARSTDGAGHVNFRINNQTVTSFTLGSSMRDYTASSSLTGDIIIQFDNDASGRDVQIDYLSVDGDYRQAENMSYNTGVWQDGSCGGSNSEWLHCNGSISFGNTPSGSGSTTTTSGGGGGSNVNYTLRARSTDGRGQVNLRTDNNTIATWTLGSSMSNYTASSYNTGDISVEFYNDATDRDVQIDYLEVNGDRRQAEDMPYNSAVWEDGSCGGDYSEWMHCNGVIGFYSTPGGGGSITTTTTSGGTTTTSGGGGGTRYISQTIRVNGGTYDGGGERIIAQGMGDGSQDEDQDPIFRLENATLRNVRIAAPGCDGVHCYGDCRVENVVWEDVGEDALTVKGSGTTTVSGGSARYASDKVFQLNQPCTFRVENFTAEDFGCFIRQNGGTSFQCTIYLNNVTLRNGSYGVRTDASSTQIYYRSLSTSNIDRVWRVPNQSSQVHSY